jgi:hypothetical protein
MTPSSAKPDWSVYEKFFRRDAHQLLAWGYEDARSEIKSDQEETTITGFIIRAIRKRLNSFDTPEKYVRYAVMEDNPIEGEGREGKERRRLDINIECCKRGPRPQYIFEAKRLRKSSHAIGYYAGDEGLKRFVQGKYATDYPEAAMVGYVQSDTPDYWMKQLSGKLKKDTTGEFGVKEKLGKGIVLPSLPDEWVSKHERTGNTPIVIYHVLLDCSAIAA